MTDSTFLFSVLLGAGSIVLCMAFEYCAGRVERVLPVAYGGCATLAVVAALRFIVS